MAKTKFRRRNKMVEETTKTESRHKNNKHQIMTKEDKCGDRICIIIGKKR